MRPVYTHRRAFLTGTASVLAAASLALKPFPDRAMASTSPIVLRAKPGISPIAKGLDGAGDTEIWGYGGIVPGATIRCRKGEPLHVRLINELNQPTSIHWHGLRIDNAMDGVIGLTQDPVAPGESFDYIFTPPDAGTFAANARTFRLQLKGADAKVIALDGAPVAPFDLPGDPYELASGQRVDLAVDVAAGEGERLELRHVSRREELMCASFAVTPAVATKRPALRALDGASGYAEPDLASAKRQDLIMTGGAMGGLREAVVDGKTRSIQELAKLKRVWAMNGIAGDMDKPLLSVKQGKTVVITMKNDTAWSHAMHLHGHHFKAVERNGKPVDGGHWRDTEMVDPDQSVGLAFVADNPGKWFLHCHMLEHQAAGMRTWINVEP